MELVFPHYDPDESFDGTLSGKYLFVAVRKREIGLQYVNDIYVVSNSMFTPFNAGVAGALGAFSISF